jgi:hypothetical protein
MFEGLAGGFGLQGIIVLQLPVDAAAVVCTGGDGKVEYLRDLIGPDGDAPALGEGEAQSLLVPRVVILVVWFKGCQALIVALNRLFGEAFRYQRTNDGVRDGFRLGIDGVLIFSEGVEADRYGCGVGKREMLTPGVQSLLALSNDGMLECWLLLNSGDQDVTREYAAYRQGHRDLLIAYIDKYVIHTNPPAA